MARYIDAEELCRRINECWETNDIDKGRVIQQVIDRVITPIIVGTPTADVVEVKHGEYIYSSTDDKWHCSECFAERPRNNGDIPYSDIYCCYKCGAKMMGGNDAKGSN